tara:strand:+ start:35 stop:496 length:462 start_codon:yes stop_codon:yes gene_type:complete
MKKLDKEQLEAIVDLFPYVAHEKVTEQLTEIGLIEPKFELNKWYQFKKYDFIFFAKKVNSFNDVIGYGFNKGVFEDSSDGAWCDVPDCEPVTELEVLKSFIKVAKDKNYSFTEMSKCTYKNEVKTNNGIIFKDGKWLPKQVTIKGINYTEINK